MKKRRNKGFTLVEAVVAFAVLGIAVLGIGGFFVSAARSYSSVSDETALQYEAQLTLNQMEHMLIDSTLGISYNCVTDDEEETGYEFVKSDSQVTAEKTVYSKVLYAFNSSGSSNLDVLLLKWVDSEDAVYYKEMNIAVSESATVSSIDVSGGAADGWDLLAEDVTEFSVDLTGYEENKKVKLNLGFENRSKDYKTEGTVLLRNNVLVNSELIKDIYARVTEEKKAIIGGVEVAASNNVVVPGSTIELTTNVTSSNGVANTKQDITQWTVRSGSVTLFDSLDEDYEDAATNIVTDTANIRKHTLNVGDDAAAYTTLTVTAIVVDGGNTHSSSVEISVKIINDIVVTASADTSILANQNLVPEDFVVAKLSDQKQNALNVPKMELRPNNVVQFSGTVSASATTAEEKELRWSLVDKPDDVIATIDNSGKLTISPYSKVGAFTVRASLRMDNNVFVDYRVKVNPYGENDATLVITADKTMINRGGSLNCSLTLDNVPVDNKDYDWVASVTSSNGKEITNNSVVINEGKVSVGYDLSFDYDYVVWIKASLKSNSDINAEVSFSIPKVSLEISPLYVDAIMGDVVSNITCTAKGLENYDIRWAMAKELNPKYFFTAAGNFNITGSKTDAGVNMATVVLGDMKQDPQTSCIVKAYLKDYANYSATMNVNTLVLELVVTSKNGKYTVTRGSASTIDFDASLRETIQGVSVNDSSVTWEIADVKVDGKSNSSLLNSSSLSLSNAGVLTVGKNFAQNSNSYWGGENYDGKKIVITIKVTSKDYDIDPVYVDVTVREEKMDDAYISPKNILIPDGKSAAGITYTYTDAEMTGITWSVTKDSNSVTNRNVKIDPTTGVISANKNESGTSDNGSYTIKASKNSLSASTKLHYGFENLTSNYTKVYEETYRVRENWQWVSKTRRMEMRKSEYSCLNASKERCDVYYVRYTDNYKNNSNNTSFTYYAFVANTTNAANGSGQWYIRNGSSNNYSWVESSTAPTYWDDSYFNK